MLNRLMFVYFIQRKGFLDGDPDYLRNKLADSKRTRQGQVLQRFPAPAVPRGLRQTRERTLRGLEKAARQHPVSQRRPVRRTRSKELHGKDIQFPTKPSSALRLLRPIPVASRRSARPASDNEINPDVLGYIFEKYINQKQMGAYYTKEDITEYISKNTVLPFLFDAARSQVQGRL